MPLTWHHSFGAFATKLIWFIRKCINEKFVSWILTNENSDTSYEEITVKCVLLFQILRQQSDCFKYNSGCLTHWQQWSQGSKCKSYQNTAAAAADATLLCIALAVKNVHLTGPYQSKQKSNVKKFCCLLIELQHTLSNKPQKELSSPKCQNISDKHKDRTSYYSCNKTCSGAICVWSICRTQQFLELQ